jgi:acyl-CoA thioesterase
MCSTNESKKQYFENDRFAAETGISLVELRSGYAKAYLRLEQRHLNSVGIVHGGAIFTLADLAFAAAANSGGKVAVAINTTISFLKATQTGILHAEATEISRTRRLSVCTVRITNDAGELIALFQGTAYIKNEPFPPVVTMTHS